MADFLKSLGLTGGGDGLRNRTGGRRRRRRTGRRRTGRRRRTQRFYGGGEGFRRQNDPM